MSYFYLTGSETTCMVQKQRPAALCVAFLVKTEKWALPQIVYCPPGEMRGRPGQAVRRPSPQLQAGEPEGVPAGVTVPATPLGEGSPDGENLSWKVQRLEIISRAVWPRHEVKQEKVGLFKGLAEQPPLFYFPPGISIAPGYFWPLVSPHWRLGRLSLDFLIAEKMKV